MISKINFVLIDNVYTVEPTYNDIGLYETSPIESDILWYQFVTVNRNIIVLGYNDTDYSLLL
jgi:hypothetical protein